MAFPSPTKYSPIETVSYTAKAGDSTNKYVIIDMPRKVTNVIASVVSSAGVANTAGLKITITSVADTSCKVKIELTAVATGDVFSVIAF